MRRMALARKLSYLAAAEAFQWLHPSLIARTQLLKLRRMLRFCEERVPFYRDAWRDAGVRASDVSSLSDLARFPAVTREQLVAAYPERVMHRPRRPDDVLFRTSGTSGLFMEIAYSARANDFLDAIYARALFATGYRPWHTIGYFWAEARTELRTYERAGLMRKTYLSLDPDPRVQLEELRALSPQWIYNFPSVMSMLARIVEEEGPRGLEPRGIICHGELMPAEIRDEISRVFRCPVWNQYGAQELNRIGWDCAEHGPMHLDADSVLLEVLVGDRPAEPGEEGELVVTGLENRLMPLVRYRIGDVGRLVPGRCACGRGLPRFEITEGRADDVIALPDGRRVGPRVLAPRIEELTGFTQYRLVQKERDRFELRVVWESDDARETGEARISKVVRDVLGDAVRVDLAAVDSLELSRRGKLRKIVSEMS
jgi:phenylacetate-CoA ligase